jgi:hypothetical protein
MPCAVPRPVDTTRSIRYLHQRGVSLATVPRQQAPGITRGGPVVIEFDYRLWTINAGDRHAVQMRSPPLNQRAISFSPPQSHSTTQSRICSTPTFSRSTAPQLPWSGRNSSSVSLTNRRYLLNRRPAGEDVAIHWFHQSSIRPDRMTDASR